MPIRRLTSDDLDALVILEAAQPVPRSREQLTRELADAAVWVGGIEVEGVLAGYAVVMRLPFEAELQAMLVAGAQRRRGLASRLLEAVVAQARAWECERLLLEVRAGNAVAIPLYRRAGFTVDGTRRGYYPPPRAAMPREDAVLMSLPLG